MQKLIFLGLALLVCLSSCKRFPVELTGLFRSNSNKKNPIIYQVNARSWLYYLSESSKKELKTLKDIPDEELDALPSGIDYLYLLGVWGIGEYGLKHDREDPSLIEEYRRVFPDYKDEDIIGCPFAITDYICNVELCPNGNDDLRDFRKRLAKRSILLMLDFVPNHSAYDSPWMDNIELYVHASKDEPQPYNRTRFLENGVYYGGLKEVTWTDTAQLNYWNQDTRNLMSTKLEEIADLADGIRVDVAWAPLNSAIKKNWGEELAKIGYSQPETEFWGDAIRNAKTKHPQLVLLAETFGEDYKELIPLGFDFCYDLDVLNYLQKNQVSELKQWIESLGGTNKHMSRFLENHDVNRAMYFFKNNYKIAQGAAYVAYTLPGMRFFFQDFPKGYTKKLEIHLRRSAKEDGIKEMEKFYKELMPIFADEVLKKGDWELLKPTGSNATMAWMWTLDNKRIIIVTNFNPDSSYSLVPIPTLDVKDDYVSMVDKITKKEYIHKVDDIKGKGFPVIVESYGARILEVKKLE